MCTLVCRSVVCTPICESTLSPNWGAQTSHHIGVQAPIIYNISVARERFLDRGGSK